MIIESLPNLISMEDLSPEQITTILDTAVEMEDIGNRPIKKVPTLRGRTVCNFFLEDSTRTRISFDIAAKRLSADVLTFSAKGSSVSKGESLKDTALTLRAMGLDCVVVRASSSGAPLQLSRILDVPVLNAGDGWHQHPTQALLDLYTIRRRLGRLDGLTVALAGDVLHSRVARSEVQGLIKMGATVRVCAPPTLLPPAIESWGVEVVADLDEAIDGVDVVYLLRVQRERMHRAFFPSTREYARLWGMDTRRLERLPEHAVVMHPGPMNRGVEIAPDVADSPRSLVTEQVANGIAVRMACLYLLLATPAGGTGASSATDGAGQRDSDDTTEKVEA